MVEQQLRGNLAKEKELVEMKNRLISSISHEFRTPLSAIISSTELLEYYSQRWSEEKKLEILGRISYSANKLTSLIEDILVYSRAEGGKLQCNRARLNLTLLCTDLVNSFQVNAGAGKILSFTEIGESQEAFLDQKLVNYILNNLLSNAIKYSGPAGQIDLVLEWQPEKVILRVKDNGIGIPLQDQANLFEPFQRASNVGSIAGTGFGLVIAKQSVLAHQGQITLDSEVGQGTTFTVTLPLTGTSIEDSYQKPDGEKNLYLPTGNEGLTEAEIVTQSQTPFMRSWLLEQAIEASNSGFVVTLAHNHKTRNSIIYASKGFEKLTGYLREEVIGKNCRFLQGADLDQEGLAILRRSIKEEQYCKVIVRNYRKDGSLFYNELQLSPIRDHSGKVVYFIGIQNDVSERIKAEAALNRSEQKFKALVENSPDIITRFDRNGRYLYANPTLVKISEGTLTADMVKGKSLSELGFSQELLDGYEDHIKEVFETGKTTTFEVAPEIPDRLRQYYQALMVPEYSSDGKEVVSVLSIGRDITDLKRTNTALEVSEKRLSSILNSITDAFITLNAEWKFTYLNPRAEKLLQQSREEFLGKNIWEKFPEVVGTNFWEKCHLARKEMQAVNFEEYFMPLACWLDVYIYPSEDGVLSVYFHDISNRKAVEEELKKSETRFRSLVEQGSDIVILLGADNRIKYVSPSAGPMLGYDAEDLQRLIGQNWLEDLLPSERATIERMLPDFLKNPGESMKFELQFLHKNGFRLFREVTFQNLLHLAGVEAIVVNSRDIHERKLAEEALRKSEQEYRLLMEQAPVAIYICDEKEKILEVNEACCALTGYSREELLQRSLPDLVPRELEENKRTPRPLLDQNNIISRVRRLRRKDDSWINVETNLRLIKDTRIVGIARNISEQSTQPQLKGMHID